MSSKPLTSSGERNLTCSDLGSHDFIDRNDPEKCIRRSLHTATVQSAESRGAEGFT